MRLKWVLAICALTVATAGAQVPQWQEMGPSSIGARVTALAVDPANPLHLMVGTPAGGVWESIDGGQSWTGATLWLASIPISAAAIAPNDPATVLLGTGLMSDSGSVQPAIGTMKSSDDGADWTQEAQGGDVGFVSGVTYWPGDPQRVLVATDRGIRLSLDGGQTFTAVLIGEAVYSIVPSAAEAGVAFATSRTGLFRSNDSGATWANVSSWPLLPTDTFGAGTTALAVSSRTPGMLVASVQVMASFTDTDRVLLLESKDGGQTFVQLTPPPGFCPTPISCGFAHTIAFTTSDQLYVGGDQLARLNDDGVSWQSIAPQLKGIHTIAPVANHLYLAGRFGVAELNTDGLTATLRNSGLAITQVADLDVSNDAIPQVLAATADSGTLIADSGTNAFRVAFAPGEATGSARFDPFDSSHLVVSRPGGDFYRSANGGTTFSQIDSGLDFTQSALDVAPLAPSPTDPGTWFTGRLQMFSTTNNGGQWAPFRPTGSPEIGVIAPSPVVSGRMYFATRAGGNLYKADGTTTEQLAVDPDPNLQLTSVFLDGAAQNQIYVSAIDPTHAAGRLFKTADFGGSWTELTPPLLPPATSIVKDRFGALYAGSSAGVWRSANDGYTWVPFNNRLFAGGVNFLKIGGQTIFAGTSGRGVFRTPEQSLFSIESIADHVNFLVDGVPVTAPYLVHWEPGSQHTITPVLTNTADSRESFLAWSDGTPATNRTIAGPDGSGWLVAAVRRAFLLQGKVQPPGGGSLALSPASPDGFYDQQSVVLVIPIPADDHRLVNFGGDLTGSDGLIAYAQMDRPRTVSATFTPLRTTIDTSPSGMTLSVDGQSTPGPVTYQWAAGSQHAVGVPEIIGDPGDLRVLAFDAWTDLLPRSHTVTMTRSTFVTDLTARYVSTALAVTVPAGGSRHLTTSRASDAPRIASLGLSSASGATGVPASLQFVRGAIGNTSTMELALVPSTPRTWTHEYVEQDLNGAAGRIRLALFNPTATDASVGLLLRGPDGSPLAAQADAVTVAAGTHVVAFVDDLLSITTPFKALLSIQSDQPLVTSVQSMRSNPGDLDALDPLLVVPFLPGDVGVPANSLVQALLLTQGSDHTLVVVNTGFQQLSGSLQFFDAGNAPLLLPLDQGAATSVPYDLAPGGFLKLHFDNPAGTGSALIPTGWVLVSPDAGQPAPMLQLTEATTSSGADGSTRVLPRSLPPSTLGWEFWIPANAADRESGAILNNVTSSPLTLTIRVIDPDGNLASDFTRTVPVYGQVVISSNDVLANLADDFTGVIQIDAGNKLLFGVGYSAFTNERQERGFAAFPLLTGSQSSATYPFAIDGDSWQSDWWFVNPSTSLMNTSLATVGRNAQSVYFPLR